MLLVEIPVAQAVLPVEIGQPETSHVPEDEVIYTPMIGYPSSGSSGGTPPQPR